MFGISRRRTPDRWTEYGKIPGQWKYRVDWGEFRWYVGVSLLAIAIVCVIPYFLFRMVSREKAERRRVCAELLATAPTRRDSIDIRLACEVRGRLGVRLQPAGKVLVPIPEREP